MEQFVVRGLLKDSRTFANLTIFMLIGGALYDVAAGISGALLKDPAAEFIRYVIVVV